MKRNWKIVRLYNGGIIVKKEIRGRIYAIAYSRDMTDEMIINSMINNPPVKSDWKPYNETEGIFLR